MPNISVHRPPRKKVTLISFDGDGTLWDFDTVMRRALQAALNELKQIDRSARANALEVDDLIDLRDRVAKSQMASGLSLEEIRSRSFVALVEQLGIEDANASERLNDAFFTERFGSILPYDDTVETLSTLQVRFKIGLLTNGNTDPRRHGLGQLFDFTMFADNGDFAKPDPRFYEDMLAGQTCKASQAIHVGDSLVNDIEPAQKAGLYAVWLNRTGAGNDTQIAPDATIDRLDALPGLLG